VTLAVELLGGTVAGARVAVLGATFKPNSDDVRDAPSLAVARMLAEAGAGVHVYDPAGLENARRVLPGVAYEPTLTDAVRHADLVCVLTEWADFRTADPVALGRLVRGRNVIDGRNCLEAAAWIAAGWHYRGMGRNPS
jgi:UDPglucose 6-dehydrogenase